MSESRELGNVDDVELPLYLKSPQDFRAYLGEQFDTLTSTQKGERFAQSALLFVQAQQWAEHYPKIRLNPKKSGELGRDILSDSTTEGSVLFGEAKYSLEGVEEFDSVLSKWKQVEYEQRGNSDGMLFSTEGDEASLPHYTLVSGTDISSIVRRYKGQRERGARDFFDQLEAADRIHYYGLQDIYKWLRTTYLRQHGIPSNFKIKSDFAWTRVGNAYLGAVRGAELVSLIDSHGESLFFENIRGWLGERSQVNSTIMQTVQEEPEKFLERNNGVTFRADGVTINSDGRGLTVRKGNIINGCQTTMALWQCRPTSENLFVQVKVVDAEAQSDAWKIAESANLQNQVTLLELKLAQHLRPQLVARHASRLGRAMEIDEPNNLEGVLQAVSASDASYNLAKFLFLGLFSRKPNNLFADNYERLRGSLVSEYYSLSADAEQRLFEALFLLMDHGRKAIDAAAETMFEKEHAEPFARVFQEGGVKYRALILLLAACGYLRVDLSEREESDRSEARRVDKFLNELINRLPTGAEDFDRACRFAVHTLFSDVARDTDDPRKMKQYLFNRMGDISFARLYQSLVRAIDLFPR